MMPHPLEYPPGLKMRAAPSTRTLVLCGYTPSFVSVVSSLTGVERLKSSSRSGSGRLQSFHNISFVAI
eukprot:scaffold13140_cov81-Cyclotella_meneghiniana.AAC.4